MSDQEPVQPTVPLAPHGPTWKERAFGLRALVATGVAGVLLGVLGGVAIGAVTGGDDERVGPGHVRGPGGPGFHGPPGVPGGPPPQQGQVP